MKIGEHTITTGSVTVVSLLLCFISGIVISFRYDDSRAYESVLEVAEILPFGWFFRNVHYFSGQLVLAALAIHIFSIVARRRYDRSRSIEWLLLMCLMITVILANLSGFILRGDTDSESAAAVFGTLLSEVPLIGFFLKALFFSNSVNQLNTLYFQHIFMLTVLIVMFSWVHLRHLRHSARLWVLVTVFVVFISFFLDAPVADPPGTNVLYRSGPWYFIGFQESLRYVPLSIAGHLFPMIAIMGLAVLPSLRRNSYRMIILVILAFSLVIYITFSISGYLRLIESNEFIFW